MIGQTPACQPRETAWCRFSANRRMNYEIVVQDGNMGGRYQMPCFVGFLHALANGRGWRVWGVVVNRNLHGGVFFFLSLFLLLLLCSPHQLGMAGISVGLSGMPNKCCCLRCHCWTPENSRPSCEKELMQGRLLALGICDGKVRLSAPSAALWSQPFFQASRNRC